MGEFTQVLENRQLLVLLVLTESFELLEIQIKVAPINYRVVKSQLWVFKIVNGLWFNKPWVSSELSHDALSIVLGASEIESADWLNNICVFCRISPFHSSG